MKRTAAVAVVVMVAALAISGCSTGPTSTSPTSPRPSSSGLPASPRLLFEWYPSGQSGKALFLAAADGSGATLVADDVAPGSEHVHSDWSPDGKQIAFEALTDQGTSSVWLTDADGANGVETVACVQAPCVEISYPSWSPDGKQLIVVQYDTVPSGDWGATHLVIVDLASKSRRVIAETPDGTSAFYSPRWSPDGTRVVVQLETYPDASESVISSSVIAVADATAQNPQPTVALTDPAMFGGHPDWSPRGDLIVFDTYDLSAFQSIDQPSNLYLISPDGTGLRQLTTTTLADGLRVGEPSWTPDGDRIVAALGIIGSDMTLTSAQNAYVDPRSGAINKLGTEGASGRLQPVP